MKLKVVSLLGQNTTLEANDAMFGAKVNQDLIAQAVRVYLSNQRQGTSKVKTRSEIARTKKKWFKQKGTGNARHGARTANIFVGGGVAHGPTGTQNWDLKLTASMRKAALASALSAQAKNIVVSDDLHQLDGKTASAAKMINKMLPEAKRILVVLEKAEREVLRSIRNLDKVVVSSAEQVTTYQVAAADGILMTKNAVHALETRGEKKAAKPVKTEAKETKSAAKAEKTEVKKAAPKAKAAKPAAKPAAKTTKKATKAK